MGALYVCMFVYMCMYKYRYLMHYGNHNLPLHSLLHVLDTSRQLWRVESYEHKFTRKRHRQPCYSAGTASALEPPYSSSEVGVSVVD